MLDPGLRARRSRLSALGPGSAPGSRLCLLGSRLSALGSPFDVRREGHDAVGVQNGAEVDVRGQPQQAPTQQTERGDLRFEVSAGQREALPYARAARGLDQRLPAAAADRAHEQDLDGATVGEHAEEPGRQHPRVVQDDEIARPQVLRQIREHPVLHLAGGAMEHAQS
jgi:hypothetical protein